MSQADSANSSGGSPFSEQLGAAIEDYRYLLDRSYPERGSLQLVGDRYRLSGEERLVLYRGAAAADAAKRRRCRLLRAIPATAEIYIDGYNVLFVLLNYRLGRLVFVCDDGFVRDAGGAHGRVSRPELLTEAVTALCEVIRDAGAEAVVYLDRPVTASLRHAALVTRIAAQSGAQVRCEVVESADRALAAFPAALLATSDSAVIDAHHGAVTDLARIVLESRYDAGIPDLAQLFRWPRRKR